MNIGVLNAVLKTLWEGQESGHQLVYILSHVNQTSSFQLATKADVKFCLERLSKDGFVAQVEVQEFNRMAAAKSQNHIMNYTFIK